MPNYEVKPDYRLMAKALSSGNIAPYGIRFSEELMQPTTAKGKGYFGEIPDNQGRNMTEYSSAYEQDGKLVPYPLITPNLTKQEVDLLKMGGDLPPELYQKSEDWAKKRIAAGQSPFASPQELRYPMPRE